MISKLQNKTNEVKSQHKTELPDFRRASLLNFVLFALFATSILYAVLNFALKYHKHYIAIGLVEAVVSVLALITIIYYQKTKNIKITTNITIILLTAVLFIFFALVENDRYTFYWICVYPPVVYFLLGRKKANIVVCLFGACILLFMISQYANWYSNEIKIDSIINIAGATTVLILVIRYFEISRTEAINALKEKNKELEGLTVTDYLTGLYNRIKLDEVLSAEIKNASATSSTFSIIMSDLDNFKNINDNYSHIIGDSVLVDVAYALKKGCRVTDIIGRWGGEEFLIVCPHTNKDKAKELCELLMANIWESKYIIEEKITMSFGIAEYRQGDSLDTLLNRADKALYYAKENGKCCIETFERNA